MINTQNLLFFFSVLLSALVAGLLYGYFCSVNPGLGRLGDKEYLQAMQSINQAILNPVFFASFVGTLFILPIATIYSWSHCTKTVFLLMLGASICYIAGVIGVTGLGNIPLNDRLDKLNIAALSSEELQQFRSGFENSWRQFHAIRTLFSLAALALAVFSILTLRQN